MGGIDRREFLRRTALGGAGMALATLPSGALGGDAPAAGPPRVRRRARLGRTGLEISDVSFGGSRLDGDEAVVRHALERGITYFDTAESYTGGESEATLGRVLQGRRDQVLLGTKVSAGPGDTRAKLMLALEGSLRRLRTDHVDLYLNHAVNDPARLKNDEWYEFVAQARSQGKIRFSGMSGHGGRLVECLDHALDHDLVDVVLVAHHFGQDPAFYERFTRRLDLVAVQPDLPRVLGKARRKGVGVIAMKTLMGGRLNDLRPYETGGGTFAQAALRWVLASGLADALVVTMKSPEAVDEYLGASGWQRPRPGDVSLLDRYLARNGATQCRFGCGACESACPAGVPVPEVLRTRMYLRDYADAELAREEYARLGTGASPCLACAAPTCTAACPHGLDVGALTGDAARAFAAPGPLHAG
jgi:predicted aldo/keto reductase-like oxidoreductase